MKKLMHKALRLGIWAVFVILIAFAIILGIAQEPVGAIVAFVGAVAEGLVLRFVVYPKDKARA